MSIDPKILKAIQGEDAFSNTQQRGNRRVKLQKGQNWIVRFLPAAMGPEGLWFARIAKHWVNKLPITCPRLTAAAYGGDPEAHCPVCDLSDELNDSAEKEISKVGYDAKASVQYMTWCAVFEKDGVAQSLTEILNPYEFWHYHSTWDELKGFYVGGGRKCVNSVLDYENGNDFSVSKFAPPKGMRLDKLDSSPIFDLADKRFDEYIKKLEAAMKTPKVVMPTATELNTFTLKLQAVADRAGGEVEEAPRRGAGRRADFEDEAAQPRRRAAAAEVDPEPEPAPRRRAAEVEPGDDDIQPRRRAADVEPEPEPEPEQPRRRAAVSDADATPRRGAPKYADNGEGTDLGPQPRRRAAEVEPEVDPEPEPAPRRRAAEVEPEPAPTGRRQLEKTARRAAEPAAPRASVAAEDPEDDLPEERKDSAPPEDGPPPPVRRAGGAGSSATAAIDRLSKLPRTA